MGIFKESKRGADPEQWRAQEMRRGNEPTKEEIRAYRVAHPLEKQLNLAAMLRMWPSAKVGMTRYGPIRGGHAELFNADSHRAWTASRLGAGAVTGGISMLAFGRKNKGDAAINIIFGNGAAQSFTVTPDSMAAANRYVIAFNAYAKQLEGEADSG